MKGLGPRLRGVQGRAVVLVLLLGLVFGRAFFPDQVQLDGISVTVILVATLLTLAPLLTSAKLPGGAEFQFRSKVDAAEQLGTDVQVRAYREGFIGKSSHDWPQFMEFSDNVRELALERPADALAQLRQSLIEGIRRAARGLARDRMPPQDPLELLTFLSRSGQLWPEQLALMRVIWDLSTNVPLQGEVSPRDAARLIAVADVLNDSFPLGYSLNFQPNPAWEENGLLCEFEHCVENMPHPAIPRSEQIVWRNGIEERLLAGFYDEHPQRKLEFEEMLREPVPDDAPEEIDREGACPVFGHFCPGGVAVVARCPTAREWREEVQNS